MCMTKFPYFLAVIPISMLLTASFFVLFTLRKVEERWLKTFGYVVTGFLWLAALIVFSGAAYKMTQVYGPMDKKMGCMSQMSGNATMTMGMSQK